METIRLVTAGKPYKRFEQSPFVTMSRSEYELRTAPNANNDYSFVMRMGNKTRIVNLWAPVHGQVVLYD
ncbi:CUN010 hypothetical protein [Culex nigripalpus nucleopolyhedrovirus]|uniref:Uncharacterized protein n=2 Tax=Deltabaculovirus TaxID=558019 RepID=Q77GU1_NPVCO|nr:CUN010 hypothetical protein [Culex nigripalpus nucleopolyhedrovirus]AAK13292.1 unknown [Culex nigripalpus nucleopolyhedrovirus]AAK94088.1 CUN010 hypothetical protein [Culex nigripalpus nucleopolyhedrovirus]